MLLSEISQFTKDIDTKFLYESWKKHISEDLLSASANLSAASPLVPIMEVVGNQAPHMSKVAVDDIKSECEL